MTTLATLVGFRADRSAPRLAGLAARLETALRRAGAGRYAEECARIARTGRASVL